jgi:hypothetical protein
VLLQQLAVFLLVKKFPVGTESGVASSQSLPLDSILGHLYTFPIFGIHFSKITLYNYILLLLSSEVLQPALFCISCFSSTCSVPCSFVPRHLVMLIVLNEQYKLWILSRYFISVMSKYSFRHSSQTPSVSVLLLQWENNSETSTYLKS